MELRTWLYRKLNPLFGTPQRVDPNNYTRPMEIFNSNTKSFLEGLESSFRGKALVIGCGSGTELQWIAERVDTLVAVDVSAEAVEQSLKKIGHMPNVTCQVVTEKLPCNDESIDIIFMHDVCEHIIDLEYWFSEYYRVLKLSGVFINQFSPLFYSPYGAHMVDALKIPWGHLIFGLQACLDVRNTYYPGHLKAESWAGVGLNKVTLPRYRKIVKKAGFKSESFNFETSMNVPLGWVPLLRNLFILKITDIMRKEPLLPS